GQIVSSPPPLAWPSSRRPITAWRTILLRGVRRRGHDGAAHRVVSAQDRPRRRSALGLLRYGFAIAGPRNDAIPDDSLRRSPAMRGIAAPRRWRCAGRSRPVLRRLPGDD